jgi:hypothetical protein
MDQTEIVRLGKEAGYSEKNLRTARERLGIKPKKEGFGADGKWVWVPTSSATALKLVVDNDANKQTPADGKQPPGGAGGGADNKAPDSHHAVQDARTVSQGSRRAERRSQTAVTPPDRSPVGVKMTLALRCPSPKRAS